VSDDTRKFCGRCKRLKPFDQFHRNRANVDGLATWCTSCRSEGRRITEKCCEYCELVKPINEFDSSVKKFCKQCAETPTERRRRYHLKSYYDMTQEDFDNLWSAQGGKCPCGVPLSLNGFIDNQGVHIDHDHACCPGVVSCGECVRGLLCGPCNRTIGHAQESPRRLIKLATYLGVSQMEIMLGLY
jgi:hypothetical protein